MQSDRHVEFVRRMRDDFAGYARAAIKIRTKAGEIKPLVLNSAQRIVHERLEEQRRTKGRVRAILLKGRQQGMSTYTEARFFWRVTHRRGVRAYILTHVEDASASLFNMAKRFYENMPEILKPSLKASNAKELIFGGLDSSYRIATAGSKAVGRGETLQYFHGSEVGYWPNASDHMAGVMQAVPDAPETEIILESTSAGATGVFYDLCMSAMRGENAYELIFVPWFLQEEYRTQPAADFKRSADEEALAVEHKLDDSQLAWRRVKLAELGNDITRFRREYPCTIAEAFETEREGALWTRRIIADTRREPPREFRRIVVAIDPAASSNESSDETGIIVAGLGIDGHGYVLADLSGKYKPNEWAQRAVAAYHEYKADRIIAEVNNGGEMVEHTLKTYDRTCAYKSVHASKGKYARAEPVAALYEQHRVHHTALFTKLEDQMTSWVSYGAERSPDRIDALTWAMTELMLTGNVSILQVL